MMDSSEIFTCDKCPKRFSILGRYNQHLKTHSRPIKCDKCEKGFALRSYLTRHKQARHRLGKVQYACAVEHCTFKATRKDNVRQHLRKSHPDHRISPSQPRKRQRNENDPMVSQAISVSAQPESENQQPLACLPTLMQAATSGNIGLVESILGLGVEVSSRADDGSTALHCAARADEAEVARILLQTGAKFEVHNTKNRTPLHEAVIGLSVAVFTLLLQHGANVTEDVLCHIIETGQVELLRQALTCPGNKLIESLGRCMFEITVKTKQIAIMDYLLSMPQITRERITKQGNSAVYSIVLSGQTAMLKLILRPNKLDPNMQIGRMQLLHVAASKGHIDIVNLLLQINDVDVNMKSWYYRLTPLQMAVAKEHTKVVEQLLQHPNIVIDPTTGQTAGKTKLLHLACRVGNVDVVELLLRSFDKLRISVDDVDHYQICLTPLANAVYYGHASVAKLFLQRQDIHFNPTGISRRTLLQLAAHQGHLEILRMLFNHDKVDLTLQGNSRRLLLAEASCRSNWLMVAALLDYDEQTGRFDTGGNSLSQEREDELDTMRKLLLDKDSPANATNTRGENLWHLAAREGNMSLAILLLEHSDIQHRSGSLPIDINLRSKKRITPLHIAVQRKHHNILKLILLHPDIDINIPAKMHIYSHTRTVLTHTLRNFRWDGGNKDDHAYIANLLLAHGAQCSSDSEDHLRVFLQSQQANRDRYPAAMPGASIVGVQRGPNIAIANDQPANDRALSNPSCIAIAGHDAYMGSENVGEDYGNIFDDQLGDYGLEKDAMMAEFVDFMDDHDLGMDDDDLQMDDMMDGHDDTIY